MTCPLISLTASGWLVQMYTLTGPSYQVHIRRYIDEAEEYGTAFAPTLPEAISLALASVKTREAPISDAKHSKFDLLSHLGLTKPPAPLNRRS